MGISSIRPLLDLVFFLTIPRVYLAVERGQVPLDLDEILIGSLVNCSH